MCRPGHSRDPRWLTTALTLVAAGSILLTGCSAAPATAGPVASVVTANHQDFTIMIEASSTFADDSPVTAQSFMNAWAISPTASARVASVEALDLHTLHVHLVRPDPSFLEQLAAPEFQPLPATTVERHLVDVATRTRGQLVGTAATLYLTAHSCKSTGEGYHP